MLKIPKLTDRAAISRFIRSSTEVGHAPLVPEIPLHLATESTPIWTLTADQLDASGLPTPFWAFGWAGGQALSRYLLDNPHAAQGRRVLSLGAGSGLEAISAAKAGARLVSANDIDPVACVAAGLNADLSGVTLDILETDLLDGAPAPDADLILAGDICYERDLAERMMEWLQARRSEGAEVLVGDPGRPYLPRSGMTKLATYSATTTGALEDTDVRNAVVWRLER